MNSAVLNPINEIKQSLLQKLNPSSEIHKTQNYTMFRKSDKNREVKKNETGYKRLLESIRNKNLLDSHPIIVNQGMEVMDGQHRLEVAKELNVPIYYIISSSFKPEDIIDINKNRTPYKQEDYLATHIISGNENYVSFKKFITDYGLSITLGLKATLESRQSQLTEDQFKDGLYKFPYSQEKELSEGMKAYKEILDTIRTHREPIPKFSKTGQFRCALFKFILSEKVDRKMFMSKILEKVEHLHACSGKADYILQFLEIYNFKKKDRLGVKDLK
jgi:hypothetical protein